MAKRILNGFARAPLRVRQLFIKFSLDLEYAQANMGQISEWLRDESRAGTWCADLDIGVINYYISDPNVAFEFKIRWV